MAAVTGPFFLEAFREGSTQMKAAKLFFYSFVFMSFMLVGCGEADNTIEKPAKTAPPPAEDMSESENSAVAK